MVFHGGEGFVGRNVSRVRGCNCRSTEVKLGGYWPDNTWLCHSKFDLPDYFELYNTILSEGGDLLAAIPGDIFQHAVSMLSKSRR